MSATAELSERAITAADGKQLYYRRWQPAGGTPRLELLVVHGYAEHGGRYRELAFNLAAQGIATSAVDCRGHGKAAGQRGYVRRFADYYLDLDAALAELPTGRPRCLLGHSQGGLVALDYVSQRRSDLAALVVTNPLLGVAMPVPPVKELAAKVLGRLIPRLALPSGIPPEGVSHDPAIVDAYKRDPFVFKTATAGWYTEVLLAQDRVRALKRVELPLLYIYSDSDPIVSSTANASLSASLESPQKRVILRQGELHEVLNEVDRQSLHRQIGEWLLGQVR